MTDAQHSINFIDAMAAWGWPDYFHSLSASDLLVMDVSSLDAFILRYGAPACQTASPDTVMSAATASDGAIIVFCESKERQLVRQLRQLYPHRVIVSCSYELAGVSGAGDLPRPEALPTGLPPLAEDREPPIIILSSPYSDAEYFLDYLAHNGMTITRELISPTLLSLALSRTDFNFRRYALHLFAHNFRDGRLAIHIQTDVLIGLIDGGFLHFTDIADWLTETEARVLYFLRRDKIVQCLVARALEPHRYRSVWGMDTRARKTIMESKPLLDDTVMEAITERLHKVFRHESRIEAFLAEKVDVFRSYTLEEVVESPISVMKSLAIFLGHTTGGTIHVPDYGTAYRGLGGIADDAGNVRDAYIRSLGLEKNAAGSFVSATDRLFEKISSKD